MFKGGDLYCALSPCVLDDYGFCSLADPSHDCGPSYDARGEYVKPEHPVCWLPHSCDSWVIGGVTEAMALRDALNEFIAKCEKGGE